MRGNAAAVLVAVLAGCASPVPSASLGPSQALETPDSTQPVAGICADLTSGRIATFQLNIDTPGPRCGIVDASQSLRLVNATGRTVTVTFHGAAYVLRSGAQQTFSPTFGAIWQPGDHWLRTSYYAGAGPEIILRAD